MNAQQAKDTISAIRRHLDRADNAETDTIRDIGCLIIAIDHLTELVEELLKRTSTESDYTW